MKFPKRRKRGDNPYTIYYSDSSKQYFVSFKDDKNNMNCITVSKEIFEAFNQFELDDISQMNKYDRHIEHSQISEITLNKKLLNKMLTVEECVENDIRYQNIYSSILKLPFNQARRLILFYFYNLKQNEIAKIDHCSIRAVQYTLKVALKNLKKILKETS